MTICLPTIFMKENFFCNIIYYFRIIEDLRILLFCEGYDYCAGVFIVDVPFYCYRIGIENCEYDENKMSQFMQGIYDNLQFSAQEGLKNYID